MTYTVAVRTLCEFTAKRGDLDRRFTPSTTALEGMAGHAAVAARRGEGYETEVSLRGERPGLVVRGRADGVDPEANRLDEVKTFRGDLHAMPANRRALHWAQAKVYGALLCAARGLERLDVALVYFDVGSQQETMLVEPCTAAELEAFYVDQCDRFLAWARREAAHRAARDAALAGLAFPHAFRAGQRALAEAVWRAAAAGATLLAQAPTGIGKTLGTVFPLLRAMPARKLDKLFFLAAKTPGRALALEALATVTGRAPGDAPAPLRVVELVAREKACEHPGAACHGEACPLARGFYDRLPAAREAAAAAARLHRPALRAIARDHAVCPYWLGQEMVRWADVVVGDYHYWFDLGGLLHELTLAEDWRVGLLVDEAHNLVARAREMYSATLDRATLDAARPLLPPAVRPAARKLARAWNGVLDRQQGAYAAHDALPPGLLAALQDVNAAFAEQQAAQPEELAPALLAFWFETLNFARLAESFGAHALFDVTVAGADERASTLCLRNVVPAPHLRPRFRAAHTATLFSATLTPAAYHVDLLGLPADTRWLDVDSPFDAAQLEVRIAPLSTRYAHRPRSLAPLVGVLGAQYAARPGNYLAFFSSFDYLQQAADRFRMQHPEVPAWTQDRRMDEAARTDFLARFVPGGRGVGFAVLGGAFAEAVDLPGDRLVGAFVATLGLPQVNPVNEQFRLRLEAQFGAGHDYAYVVPGLQKVVQAAGRVIRRPEDEGVVVLIDDRFRRPDVRRLLPAWWRIGEARRPSTPADAVPEVVPDVDPYGSARQAGIPGSAIHSGSVPSR